MAISGTDRGTGTHNTGAASFTLSPGSNFASGSWAALCVAADNSSSAGSTNDFTTVTDSLGNVWIPRQLPIFDNGAASAGVQGAIFTTNQSAGVLQTGTVITVAFGSSPVAKTWTLSQITPSAGFLIGYLDGGNGTGATGTATTLNTGTITSGNLVLCAIFVEAGTTNTMTGDADTTNGNWSTQQTNEIGSTTSGSNIASQYKVVSSTATQAYNPGLGISSDYIASWAQFTETRVKSLGVVGVG